MVIVAAASSARAQAQTEPSQAEPSQQIARNGESIDLPVSVEKIQKAISRPAAIQPRSDRVVFRVEVFAKKPTVEDILGPDYLKGPVPYGGMTHSEFLNMVTPNEFKGYSIFTNKEGHDRRRHVAGDAVGADEGDRQAEGRPDRTRQGSGAEGSPRSDERARSRAEESRPAPVVTTALNPDSPKGLDYV